MSLTGATYCLTVCKSAFSVFAIITYKSPKDIKVFQTVISYDGASKNHGQQGLVWKQRRPAVKNRLFLIKTNFWFYFLLFFLGMVLFSVPLFLLPGLCLTISCNVSRQHDNSVRYQLSQPYGDTCTVSCELDDVSSAQCVLETRHQNMIISWAGVSNQVARQSVK